MQDNERIIELIAKGLDEPLDPQEQALVDSAMENSFAIRVAADGLREFDNLLKRTGMVLPDEGFPLRVIQRLELYEAHRNRLQWYITLGIFFLGLLAASLWVAVDGSNLLATILDLVSNAVTYIPLTLAFLVSLARYMGQGPLLLYAFLVLALTIIWARLSGNWNPIPTKH
jgi:hypothetical protein